MDRIPETGSMENPIPNPPLAGLDPAELLRQGAADDTLSAPEAFEPTSLEEMAALFPQFEILELIGKGGMGAVYKVRQKDLDRIVALKILPPAIGQSPEFSARFTREAKALAKLNHPGIVTLHEFGQQNGLYFILMEYVDGVNLARLMKTGRISPREALAIVPQICDALQFAHDQGIVHRDIKPENILLDRLGRVKVADFGIAKVVGDVTQTFPPDAHSAPAGMFTEAGKIIGTPQYMAPEQIDHPSDVDHRADIYALGVVFYQMLTGELPGKRLDAPSRKVQIDVRLDEIVLKAMEKNPEMRFQQASIMKTRMDELSGIAHGEHQPESPLRLEMLKADLLVPATGIGIVGAIFLGVAGAGIVMGVLSKNVWQEADEFGRAGWILLAQSIFPFVVGLVLFLSARGMRRLRGYGISVTGCIVSLFTVIGTPFGIWGLIILAKREVREAFGYMANTGSLEASIMKTRVDNLGAPLMESQPPPLKSSSTGKMIAVGCGLFALLGVFALILVSVIFLWWRNSKMQEMQAHSGFSTPPPRALAIQEPASHSPSRPDNPPLLMTEFGEFKSEQSLWSIRVSAQDRTLRISRQPGSSGIGISISPSKWIAQNGWFAFIEDDTHLWAYDGDQKLMLVEVTPEKSTLYETETITRRVPSAILPRISQSTREMIGTKAGKMKEAEAPAATHSIQERLLELEIAALVARKKFPATAPEFKQAAMEVTEFAGANPSARDVRWYGAALDQRRNLLITRSKELAGRYGPQHPEMVENRQQLEAVEQIIRTRMYVAIRTPDVSQAAQMKFHFDCAGDTMQDVLMRLGKQFNVRICWESDEKISRSRTELVMQKDLLEEIEIREASGMLSDREKERLVELRRFQMPETAGETFTRYHGELAASSLEGLLDQLTAGSTDRVRKSKSGRTWMVSPIEGSRLEFPVTLNTRDLTLEQALDQLCSQSPDKLKRTSFGERPWLDMACKPVIFRQEPAWEALCRISEEAEFDLIWEAIPDLVINPSHGSVAAYFAHAANQDSTDAANELLDLLVKVGIAKARGMENSNPSMIAMGNLVADFKNDFKQRMQRTPDITIAKVASKRLADCKKKQAGYHDSGLAGTHPEMRQLQAEMDVLSEIIGEGEKSKSESTR